jgi:hypothetical protein
MGLHCDECAEPAGGRKEALLRRGVLFRVLLRQPLALRRLVDVLVGIVVRGLVVGRIDRNQKSRQVSI